MKKVTITNPVKVITRNEVFTSRSTEPKIKKVESEGRDIIDYRIEEAQLDQEGNIIPLVKPPFYQTTGRSIDWTIKKGETLNFPEYVANYLVKIYPFLQVDEGLVETKELGKTSVVNYPPKEAKSTVGNVSCKYCGMNFKNEKGLGLHIGHKHFKEIA